MERYQYLIIIILALNSSIVAINHTITSFHTYTPDFYCKDDNKTAACDIAECVAGYQFNNDDWTPVTEFNLVCGNRLLAPLINTLYFSGVTVGAIVCGILADIFGRKFLVVICIYFQLTLGLCLYFANSLEAFISIRTIQGFFVQGLQGCTYTLLLEFCPTKFRTGAGVLWEIFWAFGLIFLGLMSLAIRDWHYLQIVVSIPSIITAICIWIVPESPLWYLSIGKTSQSITSIKKLAKYNKDDTFNNALVNNSNLEKLTKYGEFKSNDGDASKRSDKNPIFSIFKNAILRKHAFVMITVWFSVTLSYYGILFYLPSLSGNRHSNFIIGAVIEIVAYVLAFFLLQRFSRRYFMLTCQFVNGGILIFLGLIAYLEVTSDFMDTFIIVMTLIAKGLAVSSFCTMFIYASELFPTMQRSAAIGLFGFWARIGSLLAPQLMILTEYNGDLLPMAIMAFLIIISGALLLLLPETKGEKLVNNIDEANEMWGKSKKNGTQM
uniref:Putative synaptic vesicle transporter svop n=1 Tax=Corethrella appendiculata TaxID=1370023 RepID=U5EG39_9DIPT